MTRDREGRNLPLILTMLIAAWAVLGWSDLVRQTQAGFVTNSYNEVIRIDPGSPAEAAGLKPGDQITHFDGVPVGNAAAIAHLPRKEAGDVMRLTVADDTGTRALGVPVAALSPRQLRLEHTSTIVGFCFLLFPLTAFLRKPAEATRVLLVAGTGLSLAFIRGPQIPDFTIRTLTVAVSSLFVMVGVGALLHFLLVFPQRRPWLQRPHARTVLYAPVLLLWLLLAYRIVFTPVATEALNLLTNVMASLIIGAYLLLSLFRVLRNYSRTHQAQRKALKLNPMLLGTVLGLVPVTIAQLVFAFSPQATLPGQDFYFVTLAFIPLTWARSASRFRE